MNNSPTFFPGQDYPDREKWLAKRTTPRKLNRDVVVWSDPKPMVVGLNKLKREADAKGSRQTIVKYRHEYYTQREEPAP